MARPTVLLCAVSQRNREETTVKCENKQTLVHKTRAKLKLMLQTGPLFA